MADQKIESKIKKVQDLAASIKAWGKAEKIEIDWLDLAYERPEVKKVLSESKGDEKPELKTTVSDLHYQKGKVKVLPRDEQNRKKLQTTVKNSDDQEAEQALAFADRVSRSVTHEITVGLDIAASLKATAGFIEGSLETTLSLSTTKAEKVSKEFEFNPETRIKVKGQHEAQVAAYLYPIPEIHPFEVEVKLSGKIPVYFKHKVKYHDSLSRYEASNTSSAKHLHFIPIEFIFKAIKEKSIESEIEFVVKQKKPLVVFKVKGESKVINYVGEIAIEKQTLLPGAKLPKVSESGVPTKGSTSSSTYESKRFFVGYERNAGVTFTEVTKYAKDATILYALIESIGKARGGVSGMSSADIQHAIDEASKTYLSDLDKTHEQERNLLKSAPGTSSISSERHFTGATDTFFKSEDLGALLRQVQDHQKSANTAESTGTAPTPQ